MEGEACEVPQGEGDAVKNGDVIAEGGDDQRVMEIVARGTGPRKRIASEGDSSPSVHCWASCRCDENIDKLVAARPHPGGKRGDKKRTRPIRKPGGTQQNGDRADRDQAPTGSRGQRKSAAERSANAKRVAGRGLEPPEKKAAAEGRPRGSTARQASTTGGDGAAMAAEWLLALAGLATEPASTSAGSPDGAGGRSQGDIEAAGRPAAAHQRARGTAALRREFATCPLTQIRKTSPASRGKRWARSRPSPHRRYDLNRP